MLYYDSLVRVFIFLLDALNCSRCNPCRRQVDRAKVLSNTIKQKRKEKAGKWEVPLPKVRSTRVILAFHADWQRLAIV